MNFLIPNVFAAQTTEMSQHTSAWSNIIVMLVIFMAVMYFLIWRPQNRRMKEQQAMISGLKTGDEVMTNGGILGKIAKVSGDFIALQISEELTITVQKGAISSVLPKGTIHKIS